MKTERFAYIKQQMEHEFARNAAKQYPEAFPPLPDIPLTRYTDPRFFDLERKYLWSRSWLLAGHVDELPEIGSYKKWDKCGDPILLVRGKDQQIRAFFDTCQHRGASLAKSDFGTVKVLSCNFHAWTYDLTGQLIFVPAEHEFPSLDKSKIALTPLRCELWGNLIFVNRDQNAPPLLQHLGRLATELAHFDFDKRRVNAILPYELAANWKICLEVFYESYHVDSTHPKTVSPMLDSRGSYMEMWPNGHSILMVPSRRENRTNSGNAILDAGSTSTDPRHEITRAGNLSFTVFPNISATCGEYQFPMLVFWPTGVNTTHLDIIVTEPDNRPEMDPAQAQAIVQQFAMVMEEDMSNISAIQRSIESGAWKKMRLGHQERRIYQWNEEIDRQIGAENIPPELRIQPTLGRYIEYS